MHQQCWIPACATGLSLWTVQREEKRERLTAELGGSAGLGFTGVIPLPHERVSAWGTEPRSSEIDPPAPVRRPSSKGAALVFDTYCLTPPI